MRNGDSNGDFRGRFGDFSGDYDCSAILDRNDGCRIKLSSMSVSGENGSTSTSPSPSSAVSSAINGGCIVHQVSKLDTLAGIAIKYGVEVADIKRMNGLVTDLQMFALKTIKIPLPGRHPPSQCVSNSSPGQCTSEISSSHHMQCELLDSFQTLRMKAPPPKVSPAMSTLQGFYGLKPKDEKDISEGFEMSAYRKGNYPDFASSSYATPSPANFANSSYATPSPASNPPFSHNRKTRSLVNTLLHSTSDLLDNLLAAEHSEGNNEKFVRRRQKSETDFTARFSEKLLDENSSGGGGGFSTTTGKGLALRSKASSRTNLAAESETLGGYSAIPANRTDSSSMGDGSNGVRKSSSASSLQEHDSSNYSSFLWPTSKWNLKTDLQSLSAAAIALPIFDGLPKPSSGRKNKTALD